MTYPAPFYAALHRGTAGDLGYYRNACAGADTVLELGCGYGRMVAALVRAGHRVTGIELDEGLLALAHETLAPLPAADRARARLQLGDMRELRLGEQFDRVLIPFGGLYCLLDDDQLDAALRTAALHLHPAGRLVLDVYSADGFHEEAEPDDMPDDAHTPLCRVQVEGVDYEVLERSTWDKPRQRIDASYLYVDEQGRVVEGTIEQRYLLRAQLVAALERAGLRCVELSSAFMPAQADEDPQDLMIVTAEHRDAPTPGQ